ncbi:MAG: chorismate synthase [Clostridiales bacterium]|jgi:chorismate synthase|nr:chorismate synthase [Clostridiales bacterium]
MSGSIYGTLFRIATWGESHGKGVGVTIDGCPAGLPLSEADIQKDLDKRKPGRSPFATPRKEADEVEILSGVFEGKTTGTPISLIVYNNNQRPYDYDEISKIYRPGHTDYTYDQKYGFRDYRGSGRSSGRETTARVAAGAVAKKILEALGVNVMAYTASIGPVEIDRSQFDASEIWRNFLSMPDKTAVGPAEAYLTQLKEEGNSSGGSIECVVTGLPAGIGEPVFDKLDANLAKGLMSIGAVKAVEIGAGIAVSEKTGVENNDFYRYDDAGQLYKETNYAGGIVGGISDGFDLFLKVHVKPTPSIHAPQRAVNKMGENIEVQIEGRHDPVVVPRAVIVVEAMTALTLVDLLLINMSGQMTHVLKVYNKQ